MSRFSVTPDFSHSASHPNALSNEELQQLSKILARLGIGGDQDRADADILHTNGIGPPSSLLDRAKSIYNSRQRRARFFPRMIFGEAGWDILLVLYIHDGRTRICIKDLGKLIDTPATTILRWLKVLEDENFIAVRKHQFDRRVSILDLTQMGRARVEAYLEGDDRTSWPIAA